MTVKDFLLDDLLEDIVDYLYSNPGTAYSLVCGNLADQRVS